jgi:hypothetical protein
VASLVNDDALVRQGKAIEEEMLRHRRKTDISPDDFEEHAHLLEQTIENPDEVWELQDNKDHTLLTLISQQNEELAYVVICAADTSPETGQESWRVIFSFPTNDPALVQHYRRGQLREGGDGRANFLH